MLALAVAVVVAAVVVGVGSLLLNRPHPVDEVERFHRAAHLTTEWARAGVGQPRLVDDAAPLATDPHDADAPDGDRRDAERRDQERSPADVA